MFRLFVISIVGLATPAVAADDPAVLVCEHVIKARLKAPKSYERVDYKLADGVVSVTYDAVNAFNAPLRNHYSCYFEAGKDGKIVLAPAGFAAFEARAKALAEEVEKKLGFLTQERRAEVDAEMKAIMSESFDELVELAADQVAAGSHPMYPIDPSTTSLKTTAP